MSRERDLSPIFTLRQLYSFSVILNDVWSAAGLNKRLKLVEHHEMLIVVPHECVCDKYIFIFSLTGPLLQLFLHSVIHLFTDVSLLQSRSQFSVSPSHNYLNTHTHTFPVTVWTPNHSLTISLSDSSSHSRIHFSVHSLGFLIHCSFSDSISPLIQALIYSLAHFILFG